MHKFKRLIKRLVWDLVGASRWCGLLGAAGIAGGFGNLFWKFSLLRWCHWFML
jgi:hypothetical protein